MKQMRFLVMFLLTLTVSWTASSQITGIDRDQKIQIVSTIESYDAVIVEIGLTNKLLAQCEELNLLYKSQITLKDKLINNLEAQIEAYNKTVEYQDKEIKRQRFKGMLTGTTGIIAVIIAIIIK